MSLKDELLSGKFGTNAGEYARGKCSVNDWLVSLDAEVSAEVKEILETEVSTMSLYRFLTSKFSDISFGLTTFRSHRNHWCSCQ